MPRKRDRPEETFPPPPLHIPIHHPSDPPHIDLLERVRPRLNTRQEENRLLNLRSQVGQPHDVRHAGSGDVSVVRKFGLVLDHAVRDQLVTLNRKCHEARHT